MSLVFWMCLIVYFCGPSATTPLRRPTPDTTIVTSTSSLSTTKVSSSPLLNGTSTTQTGTSANTPSTASFSGSEVISSDKQSSTDLTSTSFNGTDIDAEYPVRIIIILVVVLAVLLGSSILVIVFILHRRRYKKSSGEDASKNQIPSGLVNHSNTNFGVSNQNYKAPKAQITMR
ncbi:hypothetical protein CHS0354_020322 [Potamilus streckersoni]|uniref:Uncharacterized protein n=1 Tax=Potamilus streckersoni TaxID=2493646 RepID=A0AAE0SMC4_9BIVA|nr:hypothetical protein CHS0354_020322 [Potamilus streckersoni]